MKDENKNNKYKIDKKEIGVYVVISILFLLSLIALIYIIIR